VACLRRQVAQAEEGQQGALNADVEVRRPAVRECRLLYRPMRGLGLVGPLGFACGIGATCGAVAEANDRHGWVLAVVMLMLWVADVGYFTYMWLWRTCQWVRVDAEMLEWKTPLTRGRVPLHQVRRISLDNRWTASIHIRGDLLLSVTVQDGFEDLTAYIVAGAPHVVIERSVRSAAAPQVRPAVRDQRQFLTESAKITDPRDPPVPVWVTEARLDERPWPGLLHGWANDPLGGGAGPRGLVVGEQPDGCAYIGWALPEHLRLRT
jgi:hypothetical protein